MVIRVPASDSPSWVALEALATIVFSFLSLVIIGRVIGPEAAGTAAVALAAFLLLDAVSSSLFTEALVQRAQLTKSHSDSAITLSTLMGLIAGLGLMLVGPLLVGSTSFEMAWLIRALACLLPLSAFTNASMGMLIRSHRFRIPALRVLIGQSLGLLVGLYLAHAGYGPWAMISLQISVTVIGVILILCYGHIGARPRINRQALRDLLPIAGPQYAATLIGHGKYRLFILALGIALPESVVARSHFAFRILDAVMMPVWQITTRLSLPRLCSLQYHRGQQADAYGELVQLQSLLGLPVVVGFILVGPDLVGILLGAQWSGTAEAARLAGLAEIAFMLLGNYGSLFIAFGRSSWNLHFSLVRLLLQLFGLVLLRPETPVEVAVAWAAPSLILAPIVCACVLRNLDRSLMWLIKWNVPALLATGAMAGSVMIVQMSLMAPLFIRLPIGILVGAVTFVSVAWLTLGRKLPPAIAWRPQEPVLA
jgi:O-antigen/teichoic acid export membrane protein